MRRLRSKKEVCEMKQLTENLRGAIETVVDPAEEGRAHDYVRTLREIFESEPNEGLANLPREETKAYARLALEKVPTSRSNMRRHTVAILGMVRGRVLKPATGSL